MNPAERLNQVCDRAAAAVRELAGVDDPARVTRGYLPDAAARTLAGRQVGVYPAGCSQVGRGDRGHRLMEYRVAVAVVDRWDGPGDGTGEPPRGWCDAAAAFAGAVFDRLGDESRDEVLPGEADLWPEEQDLAVLYDPAELRQDGVFFSEIVVAYRELADG